MAQKSLKIKMLDLTSNIFVNALLSSSKDTLVQRAWIVSNKWATEATLALGTLANHGGPGPLVFMMRIRENNTPRACPEQEPNGRHLHLTWHIFPLGPFHNMVNILSVPMYWILGLFSHRCRKASKIHLQAVFGISTHKEVQFSMRIKR